MNLMNNEEKDKGLKGVEVDLVNSSGVGLFGSTHESKEKVAKEDVKGPLDESHIKEVNQNVNKPGDKRMTISNVILSTNQFKSYTPNSKSLATSYDEKGFQEIKRNMQDCVEFADVYALKKRVHLLERYYHEGGAGNVEIEPPKPTAVKTVVKPRQSPPRIEKVVKKEVKPTEEGRKVKEEKVEEPKEPVVVKGPRLEEKEAKRPNIITEWPDYDREKRPERHERPERQEEKPERYERPKLVDDRGIPFEYVEKSPNKYLYKKDIDERSHCPNYSYLRESDYDRRPVNTEHTKTNNYFNKYQENHDNDYLKRRERFFEERRQWSNSYQVGSYTDYRNHSVIQESNPQFDYRKEREWDYDEIINNTNQQASKFMNTVLYNLRIENQKKELEDLERRYIDKCETLKDKRVGAIRPAGVNNSNIYTTKLYKSVRTEIDSLNKSFKSTNGTTSTKKPMSVKQNCNCHKNTDLRDSYDIISKKKRELYNNYVIHLNSQMSNPDHRIDINRYNLSTKEGLNQLRSEINRLRRVNNCKHCKFCNSFIELEGGTQGSRSKLFFNLDEEKAKKPKGAQKQRYQDNFYTPVIWPSNNI
jgi:hypothetical protein